jgi:hypothetical protein
LFEAEKSLEFGLIKFSFTKKYLMNPSKLNACKYDEKVILLVTSWAYPCLAHVTLPPKA